MAGAARHLPVSTESGVEEQPFAESGRARIVGDAVGWIGRHRFERSQGQGAQLVELRRRPLIRARGCGNGGDSRKEQRAEDNEASCRHVAPSSLHRLSLNVTVSAPRSYVIVT